MEFLKYSEIIPIPAKPEYSFNSVEIICIEFSEVFNIPMKLDRIVRIDNDEKKYALINKEDSLAGKNILLIDDIFTDGETRDNVCQNFNKVGCDNVDMITLGRTDHNVYDYNE